MRQHLATQRRHQLTAAVVAVIAVLALVAGLSNADDAGKGPRREEAAQLPGLKIDREKKTIDIEGKVILPLQSEWLELLACMPKSREHESIISLNAQPSHIHGALLLIGLKPGTPLRAEKVNDEWKYHPPTGPKVAVTIHYRLEGKAFEVRANEWVLDQKTRKPLPDNVWLFTGSRIHNADGKQIYVADIEGNILSLVNFGDEVLSRSTQERGGQEGGGNTWAANAKAIPPAGTRIIVRLTAVIEKEKKDQKPDAN